MVGIAVEGSSVGGQASPLHPIFFLEFTQGSWVFETGMKAKAMW